MQGTLIKHIAGLSAAAGLAFAATGAQADWSRGGPDPQGPAQTLKQSQSLRQQIDARVDWQTSRIEAGVQEGSLSQTEARALRRQQREIGAMARQFLTDGSLDQHEFRRLNQALDAAGRAIRAERHDQQARFYREFHPRYN
ncbi:MAG: hypothetical protein ACLGG4_03720 [Gammaproteobacteria bacterium]|jgi:hypothetical protein